MAAAEHWVDSEFQPSVLSKEEQLKEMEWFINAAKPFDGMEINVLSEGVPTHTYESTVLTKAFEEITGIKVNHQILGEGEVVQAVQTQMQTNRNLYDAYVNDSDLIGTHSRLQSAVNLTDWMAGEGKDVTNPMLDLDDFIGKSVHHRSGRQALAAARPAVRQPLLVPQGLVRPPGPQGEVQGQVRLRPRRAGQLVGLRGHRRLLHQRREGDRRRPHLRPHGLRQARARPRLAHDRRLAVDGRLRPRRACPTAVPIDEWGIRMEEGSCNPTGASVTRGGGTNAPASVYAIAKWDEWLRNYAPPGAADLDFYQSLPALSQGNVAQQIFWYTAFTADMVKPKATATTPSTTSGNAALADGAVAARPVLEGRHEARLPGRRFVDAVQLDAGRPPQGRLALRPVRRVEDGRRSRRAMSA